MVHEGANTQIECRHCGTGLTLGSKFCWECGRPIAPEDAERARRDLEAQVAEGQRLLGENRAQEAALIADAALQADPDHVPALALKGDSLERLGEFEGALAVYERIVDLKPESPLDRARLGQIRRAIDNPLVAEPDGQGRRASIVALAASLVLVASTAAALHFASRPTAVAQAQPATVVEEGPYQKAFAPPVPTVQTPRGTPDRSADADQVQDEAEEQAADPAPARPRRDTAPRENVVLRGNPAPLNGGGLGSGVDPNGFQPVEPVVVVPSRPSQANPDDDPRPAAVVTEANGPGSNPERPPVIDVRPSRTTPETRGGSVSTDEEEPSSTGNEGEALVRTARQMALRGDYARAAQLYERAIRLGVSPASANLRLARCYVSLGRRADAAAAYRRALDAYLRLKDTGQGDPKVIDACIAEARQALRMLE